MIEVEQQISFTVGKSLFHSHTSTYFGYLVNVPTHLPFKTDILIAFCGRTFLFLLFFLCLSAGKIILYSLIEKLFNVKWSRIGGT